MPMNTKEEWLQRYPQVEEEARRRLAETNSFEEASRFLEAFLWEAHAIEPEMSFVPADARQWFLENHPEAQTRPRRDDAVLARPPPLPPLEPAPVVQPGKQQVRMQEGARSAIWGGATLGLVIGIMVAFVSNLGLIEGVVGGIVIGVLVGFAANLLGWLGDSLQRR